jgi:hypothetical protein
LIFSSICLINVTAPAAKAASAHEINVGVDETLDRLFHRRRPQKGYSTALFARGPILGRSGTTLDATRRVPVDRPTGPGGDQPAGGLAGCCYVRFEYAHRRQRCLERTCKGTAAGRGVATAGGVTRSGRVQMRHDGSKQSN